MVISDRKCHWSPVNSSVLLGSILAQCFFQNINYLYEKAKCTLSSSEDDTKMGGLDDMPEGSAAIQRNLNRLEKWAERNLINFDKAQNPAPGVEQFPVTQLEFSLPEKDPGTGRHQFECEPALYPCSKEGYPGLHQAEYLQQVQ